MNSLVVRRRWDCGDCGTLFSPLTVLNSQCLEAFGNDKASGKGLRSGASCLEVLQKRHSAMKGGNAPIWDD